MLAVGDLRRYLQYCQLGMLAYEHDSTYTHSLHTGTSKPNMVSIWAHGMM